MKKIGSVLLVIILLGGIFLYRPPISMEKLKARYTDEYSAFMEMDGMNVHYRIKGSGKPVLLIHGTSSSLHTWEFWEPVLTENFTVYSVDLPGCGLTGPHPDADYSIQAYLDFLKNFTKSIGLDSFYIAGNSLGGHIAWEYARIHNGIKKAVLVDPSGYYEEDRKVPLVFKLGRSKVFSSFAESLNVKPLISKSLDEVFYNDALITPALRRRYFDLVRRKGNRKAFVQKVAITELSPEEELQDVLCPVLLQWGKNDTWIPIELAEIFKNHLPDQKMIVYEQCGHVPQEEIPEISARDAMNFFLEEVNDILK
ncbi:MAG: alpha/beta hydrolase [Bacteroidetes bacterium]|nr:alpha/beta hydrolase [Bacteroidota bacterium]